MLQLQTVAVPTLANYPWRVVMIILFHDYASGKLFRIIHCGLFPIKAILYRELQDRFEDILKLAPFLLKQAIVSRLSESCKSDVYKEKGQYQFVGSEYKTATRSGDELMCSEAAGLLVSSSSWPRAWWKAANSIYIEQRARFHGYSMFQSWT
jgi:hypothetical protein